MTTTYPTSLQALPSPGSGTYQDDSGYELDVVVTTTNDTVEALMAKVGVGASNQSPVASRVMGADGTGTSSWRQIATGDIAANGVTQSAVAASPSGNTASTSYADITSGSATMTTVGGDVLAIAVLCASNTASANATYLALSLDAAAEVGEQVFSAAVNNGQFVMCVVRKFAAPSAASHTIKMRWKVSAGTTTLYSGYLLLVELKK